MVAERAMDRAIGHAALRAASGLFLRLRQNELARDFQKIIVAFPGGALLGIAMSGPEKPQHLAGSSQHLMECTAPIAQFHHGRPEERPVGQTWVSKCRSRCVRDY